MAEAKLKVNPTETATLIYIAIEKLLANPYRDMDKFGIDEDKIKELVASIMQTGFWPSILGRPKDNKIAGVLISPEVLRAMVLANDPVLQTIDWEKPFAHHRQRACEVCGMTEIPIIPQIISDENMMRMMALENKEGFGSSMNSQLENVRQVAVLLTTQLSRFETYEEYSKAMKGEDNVACKNANAFAAAKKDGVSPQAILNFLGGEWSMAEIRNPFEVLQAFDEGVLIQDDIVYVRNMTLLKEIASLAKALYTGGIMGKEKTAVDAPDWPVAIKTEALDAVIDKCSVTGSVKSEKVTVKMIQEARKAMLDSGTRPDRYLSTKKASKFEVYEELRKLLDPQKTPEENNDVVNALLIAEGYSEWPGIQKMVEKLLNSVKNMKKVVEGEGDGDGGDGDGGTDELDGTTRGNVDEAMGHDAAGQGQDAAGNADNAFAGDEGAVDYHKEPIGKLSGTLVMDINNVATRCGILALRRDEFASDEVYSKAILNAITSLAITAQLTIDRGSVIAAFKDADEAVRLLTDKDAAPVVADEVETAGVTE